MRGLVQSTLYTYPGGKYGAVLPCMYMITHDKTGQLPARWWLPERTITFHGRIDNQLDPYKNHAPIQPHPSFIPDI